MATILHQPEAEHSLSHVMEVSARHAKGFTSSPHTLKASLGEH